MLSSSMTQHAAVRANQRGAPHAVIEALLTHADVEIFVGGGCSALRLSRQTLQDRELRDRLGAQVDRLAGLALICDNGTGKIITVLHDGGSAAGRRYRRAQ